VALQKSLALGLDLVGSIAPPVLAEIARAARYAYVYAVVPNSAGRTDDPIRSRPLRWWKFGCVIEVAMGHAANADR
jgi:hypothetical protein